MSWHNFIHQTRGGKDNWCWESAKGNTEQNRKANWNKRKLLFFFYFFFVQISHTMRKHASSIMRTRNCVCIKVPLIMIQEILEGLTVPFEMRISFLYIQQSYSKSKMPDHVAQSIVGLTREPETLGLIPGTVTYFCFPFRRFKKCSKVTGGCMCTQCWLRL